jgi:hypothetical protein
MAEKSDDSGTRDAPTSAKAPSTKRESIFLEPEVLATLEVSPEANLFRLTPFDEAEERELQSLKVEQRHPIVLRRTPDGALIIVDGRRRRRMAVHGKFGLWAVILDDNADILHEVLYPVLPP